MTNNHPNRSVDRADAIESLRRAGVPVGGNFFTLSQDQVSALLAEADRAKYRQPRNANGSRARYFHERLQNAARTAT